MLITIIIKTSSLINRSQIIIGSLKVINDLNRIAMTIKTDGKNCAYKMLRVGFPDGENYEADLASAKPMSDIYPISAS